MAQISFLEILLNETLCGKITSLPCGLVRQAGGINKKLKAKAKYELILRIAKEFPGDMMWQRGTDPQEKFVLFEEDSAEVKKKYGWQTDCYVVGKYSAKLRESGYFEEAVGGLLAEAEAEGRYAVTLEYLEQMIGHREAYYEIDDATRPILIYKGDPICHNVLTVFADQLGSALERAGALVEYFDFGKEDLREVLRYKDMHFKAIIGMQSYLFSIKMSDEEHYLHEYIHGPKYNFLFDHPVWAVDHLKHHYPDFHVLTHDSNYVSFLREYYHQDAVLFPPAGMEAEEAEEMERVYDATFVGTCGEYWPTVLWVHALGRERRFLANRFLLTMRKNPNLTSEAALWQTIDSYGLNLKKEEFFELLYEFRTIIYCVMHYYRERVVRTILESGMRVDVFGDDWKNCRLRRYPNLVCHSNVTVEESLAIWKQSKLSLNVMSWHKAGFTERMAGIMLAGAVLVTDDTAYLQGRYDEGDMLIFKLDELDELPDRMKLLLEDESRRRQVAENGRKKTQKEHTWDRRAEQFLELLEKKSV